MLQRQIPLYLTAAIGLVMLLYYFIPHPLFREPGHFFEQAIIIVVAFAIVLGSANVLQFNGEIVPALRQLVDSGTIRILDLLFIKKDAAGNVQSFELSALTPEESAAFEELDGEIDDLLNPDDILLAAENLENNSSAGLLVWENLWAARFADAVRAANGVVLANWSIPQPTVDAALEAAQVGT